MTPYSVRILEARYDENEGMLVIYGIFEHNGDKKLIVFSKDDVSHVFNTPDLGDQNMKFFAECLSKRKDPFKFCVSDDPNREIMSEEKQMEYAALFNKRIAEELQSVQEGMVDEDKQIQRKIGRILDKEGVDINKVLAAEASIRSRLK